MWRRCRVSYVTGASSWYWLTVWQGLLSLQQVRVEGGMYLFLLFLLFHFCLFYEWRLCRKLLDEPWSDVALIVYWYPTLELASIRGPSSQNYQILDDLFQPVIGCLNPDSLTTVILWTLTHYVLICILQSWAGEQVHSIPYTVTCATSEDLN